MAREGWIAPSIGFQPLQTGLRERLRGLFEAIERWLEEERDQLPLWLPVGLGLGIAAWFALPDKAWWAAFILAALGLSLLGGALRGGGRFGRAVALFALVAALGCGWVWTKSEIVRTARLDRPVVAMFEARVEAVDRLPARGITRLRLAPLDETLPSRVRVNFEEAKLPAGVLPGARIALRARLMPPAPPTVPGAYDFARVAWFQGIGATGTALGPPTLIEPAGQGGLAARIAAVRTGLTTHIQSRLEPAEGGVAASLVTGDQGGIPDQDAEAMRRSGLAHLLSVSGLHVSAVVGGVMLLLLRCLALSPRLALHAPLLPIAAGGAAIAGIGYTLIAGSEVPTVRSCIAALLVLAGIMLGREAITLRLVAAGALLVLLCWPEALAGPSFQLSFAAVTAIVAFHEHPRVRAFFARRDEGAAVRLGRILASLLLTGILVELALSPIALFHFHRSGLYGAFANIIAIPLTTFVIMPLEAVALLFDMVGLGAPLWWLTGQALGLLLWVAHAVAAAPGAVAALPAMPRIAFGLMVAGGLWMALWRSRPRWLGAAPLLVGALIAFVAPKPGLLVTGDGRHVALRIEGGRIALLRPRAGDYVRDTLSEGLGVQGDTGALDDLPHARCGPDLCAIDVMEGGRRWRLLATRSAYLVPIGEMNRACAEADIVVSERRLPRTCRPRWFRADRPLLARTGGLAIDLASRQVRTVAETAGSHPWAITAPDR